MTPRPIPLAWSEIGTFLAHMVAIGAYLASILVEWWRRRKAPRPRAHVESWGASVIRWTEIRDALRTPRTWYPIIIAALLAMKLTCAR